jgi:DNA-binding winged helix-turn-helix (wHTH) protein/tetratricopeptide (TPR) repeat protein
MNRRFSADDLLRMDASARIPRPIDLAHTPPFRLGGADVTPASRTVSSGAQQETLEPLVMQVLVALHSACGEILSRDDLIDACWGGRAVSDDALNRVITRLRALARSFGGFQVETVTKVGYRLIGEDVPAARPSAAASRRHLLVAGGAALGLSALGYGTWRMLHPPGISPGAQLLIQKGMDALQYNDALDAQDPGSTLQAIGLLTDATRAAPQSAPAWGALAMAYAVRKRTVALPDRPGMAARSRSAAKRSLELDPLEGRALGALRMLDPVYRRWAEVERKDRAAVRKNPNLPILSFILSDMLGSVGRWKEAVRFSKQLDRTKFLIPGADRKLLIDLWASGDLQAADQFLEVAVRQWPQHPLIWRMRLAYLMYSGRPREALEVLRKEAEWPLELKPGFIDAARGTAEALAGQHSATDAVKRDLDFLARNPSTAPQIAQACVALGARTTAFAILDGYYFGEGEWRGVAPIGGDEDRITNILFQPVMGGLWREPAFDRLLNRIGLEDYWRASGTMPDYRRIA